MSAGCPTTNGGQEKHDEFMKFLLSDVDNIGDINVTITTMPGFNFSVKGDIQL